MYLRERTINVLTLVGRDIGVGSLLHVLYFWSAPSERKTEGGEGRRREIDGAARIELLRTVDGKRDPPVPVIEVSLTRNEFLGLVFFFLTRPRQIC